MIPERTLERPRKKKHVGPILDYLDEIGASDVYVTQKGHLHLNFTVLGVSMKATMASTPSETTQSIKNTKSVIRRTCLQHGIRIRA